MCSPKLIIGESLPVSKSPLPKSGSTAFGVRDAARHVLYAGTQVLQTRAESAGDDGARALVVRTGFASAKGELLRAMLHPKPLDFVYERHAWYLAGGLALLGLAGVAYALYVDVCSLILLRECELFIETRFTCSYCTYLYAYSLCHSSRCIRIPRTWPRWTRCRW